MAIWFHTQNTNIKLLNLRFLKSWLKSEIFNFKKSPGTINVIFVTKAKILEINTQYLNHSYFTDIITFDYCEGNTLSGDIFICPEVVEENSKMYDEKFNTELKRVIIHGILHLIGFDDKSDEEVSLMREIEDRCLSSVKELLII